MVESFIYREDCIVVFVLLDYLDLYYCIIEIFIFGFFVNSVDVFYIVFIYNDWIDGVIGMFGNLDIRSIKEYVD